jgi:hypothetical protein
MDHAGNDAVASDLDDVVMLLDERVDLILPRQPL